MKIEKIPDALGYGDKDGRFITHHESVEEIRATQVRRREYDEFVEAVINHIEAEQEQLNELADKLASVYSDASRPRAHEGWISVAKYVMEREKK